MGITIHWNGNTKSKKAIKETLKYAEFFAKSLGWNVKYLNTKVVAHKERAHLENKTIEWITTTPYEMAKDYINDYIEPEITNEFGIAIDPTEPFNTETICITFFKYKGKYWIKDFCKTQVFNQEETPNLIAHQLLITMLLTIKNTWIPNLEISDEGDFYLPLDEKEKEKYVKEHIRKEAWNKYMKMGPFNFKNLVESHVGNFRIINLFTNTLVNLGWDIKTPNFEIKHNQDINGDG